MKRNILIFECSGIGPKMIYLGSLGSKNLSKFSFRVLELFKISRKLTWKIEIWANFTGHTFSSNLKKHRSAVKSTVLPNDFRFRIVLFVESNDIINLTRKVTYTQAIQNLF